MLQRQAFPAPIGQSGLVTIFVLANRAIENATCLGNVGRCGVKRRHPDAEAIVIADSLASVADAEAGPSAPADRLWPELVPPSTWRKEGCEALFT